MLTNPVHIGPIDAVVFDCDGTLVDSESVWLEVIKPFLTTTRSGEADLEQFRGITSLEASTLLAAVADKEPNALRSTINERYSEALRRVVEPIDGAGQFVQQLAASVPVGVASNGRSPDVVAMMRNTGLKPYLSAIFTIDDVHLGKPDPELYLAATAHFGVARATTLVIEDSVPGVTAALRAGCTVIGRGNAVIGIEGLAGWFDSYSQLSYDPESRNITISNT